MVSPIVIYEPERTDNDKRSAALFEEAATGVIDADRAARVRDLILATKTHRSNSAQQALMVDIDLSILGRSPQTFKSLKMESAVNIPCIQMKFFIPRERGFSKDFWKSNSIYGTDYFRKKYGHRAVAI